jgi:DNA-directed RNA polymerase specialized sigma24 family protein
MNMFEELDADTLDYIRLRLWRRFGEQLRKIPEAPDPDDLLQEALEDLLSGRRKYPDENVKLSACLFMIVHSKVDNIQKKRKRAQARAMKEPYNPGTEQNTVIVGSKIDFISFAKSQNAVAERLSPVKEPSLREKILALVADDALLVQIVRLQLDAMSNLGKQLKAKVLAEKLNVAVDEIYNANRRLKARLEQLKLIQPKNRVSRPL